MAPLKRPGFWSRGPSRARRLSSGISGAHRPYHLLFHQCCNLTVRDIFLKVCAFHSNPRALYHSVEAMSRLHGLHIHNRVNHNNDGFHS